MAEVNVNRIPQAVNGPPTTRASGSALQGGDGLWELVLDVAFQAKSDLWKTVVIGLIAIYYYIGSAGLSGGKGDEIGWTDAEGGAKGEDEITGTSSGIGAGEVFLAKGLAEANGGGLEVTAAFAAGTAAFTLEEVEAGLRGFTVTAGLTFDEGTGAMDLDELVLAGAGGAMEAINILGDNHRDFTGLLELDDGVVDGVGLGVAMFLPQFQLVVPVLDAGFLVRHEVLIHDRLAGGPNATGTTKGRDTTGSGDTRAREDKNAIGGAQVLGEGLGHEGNLMDWGKFCSG